MMKYKGYTGEAEFDVDAGVLHGEVLGIRDVITFQGKSVQGLQRAFRESVDDYLAFCRQQGSPPDKPYSGQLVLRIDRELHRRVGMIAQARGMSLSSVVEESLGRALAAPVVRAAKRPGRHHKRGARTGSASGKRRAAIGQPRLRELENSG